MQRAEAHMATCIKRLMDTHPRSIFLKLWCNTVLGLFFLLSNHRRFEVNDRSSLCQTRLLVFFSWLTAGTRLWLAPFTNGSCDTAGAYVGLTGCVCLLRQVGQWLSSLFFTHYLYWYHRTGPVAPLIHKMEEFFKWHLSIAQNETLNLKMKMTAIVCKLVIAFVITFDSSGTKGLIKVIFQLTCSALEVTYRYFSAGFSWLKIGFEVDYVWH